MEISKTQHQEVTCREKIYVSRTGITLPPDWEIDNADYICDTDDDYYYIDDDRFDTNERLIEWLKLNSDHIDFEQTRNYILLSHASTPCVFETTFGEISTKLGTGTMASYHYDCYLQIQIVNHIIDFNPVSDFIDDGSCFSIPFLKAVIDRHQISDTDPIFVGIHPQEGFYFRVIDDSTGVPHFYNISKDPKFL